VAGVYSDGVAAYRDSTKWLVGFVPVATVAASGAVIGPKLIDALARSRSVSEALAHNWPPLLGVAMVVIGVGAIVASGSGVLAAQPTTSVAAILEDRNRLSLAFGQGIGAPYFFTFDEFAEALEQIADSSRPVTGDDPLAARAAIVVDALRSWYLHAKLEALYRTFRRAFVGGLALSIAGFLLAASTVDDEPKISKPTPVVVAVRHARDLRQATGCLTPKKTTFWIVDGSWSTPVLAVDGPGCRFGAEWEPETKAVEVRPARD
jgi:hypothetical protein